MTGTTVIESVVEHDMIYNALTDVIEKTRRVFGFKMQHERIAFRVAAKRVFQKFFTGKRSFRHDFIYK